MPLLLIHKDFSDIRSIPGIEPISNVELFSSFIKEEVASKGLCGGFNKDYIASSLKKADWILLLIDDAGEPEDAHGLGVYGDMLGFATLYKEPRDSSISLDCLYIDIFCTVPGRGVGTFLMAQIERVQEAHGFPQLCLCSVEDAIGFYEKLGFDWDIDAVTSDAVCGKDMPLMMRGGLRSARRSPKQKIATPRIKHNMAKTRKAHRKGSRKASRKTERKSTRKAQAGGKRSEWLNKVMRVYKEMKAKNPNTRLGDAMRAAKKMH